MPVNGIETPTGNLHAWFSNSMLVNEAIIDVAIGAAKFRGEYTGSIPIIGCPGCHGETMQYVEPEPSPPRGRYVRNLLQESELRYTYPHIVAYCTEVCLH